MRLTTDALIIRENNNIGEADRFVNALTRDLGVVRASARGARNIKSRNSSATQLLSYSRLTLYKGRDKYIIDDAEPLQVFFEVRNDIAKLSLAQYFCELAGVLAPREEPAEDFLRLLLGGLHFLSRDSRDIRQIKAVVELRSLCLSGYMPDLTLCASCREEKGQPLFFLPREGVLCCQACLRPSNALPLSPTILAALRHIAAAPLEKVFSFSIPPDQYPILEQTVETFLLSQLDRGFKTLDFYHAL